MAITTEMKVTGISQYRSAIAQAQASVKTLDQELKRNEAQFKATGDKEQYMADKSRLLQMRMQTQATAAKQAEAALKQLREQGVNTTSTAYQKLQQQLSVAQTGMLETQVELQNLTQGEQAAAQGADQLTTSVNGISKKVSLDAVISGIDKITSGMERAAKKAVELGRALWEEISNSGSWADNTATTAAQLGMGIEDYQRYQKVFDQAADITVADWQKAKQKVQKAINDPSQETTDILNLLGIQTHGTVYGKEGAVEGAARNYEEVFWEIGERLRQKVASGEMTQDLADTYANSLFGKGFANLNPIFALGQEGFAAELEKQNVVSEDAINKLAEMNDAIVKLQGDFKSLETEAISGLAPGLTAAAEALDGLLGKLLEYLQTDEGQQMLERLGQAVSGLFEDLGKIDPGQVVEGFVSVFESIISGFEWLVTNKGTIEGILMGVVTAWGAAKLTGGALQVLQLINGIRGLTGGGAGAAAAAASAGKQAGSAWATAFTNAVVQASPIVAQQLGIVALAAAPAVIAQKQDEKKWIDQLQEREEAAKKASGEYAEFIQRAEAALGPKRTEDGGFQKDATGLFLNMNPTDDADNLLMGLQDRQNQQKAELYNIIREYSKPTAGNDTWNLLNEYWKNPQLDPGVVNELLQNITDAFAADAEHKAKVPIEPEVPEDAAATIAEQIGQIRVPVSMVYTGGGGHFNSLTGQTVAMHANGLPFVPFDGYIAALHRGERVVPAREEAAHNFSSNLYVESMYMNNGMDANGLAASIAAENQRIMRGHGS